ncbi:MAG: NADPH-dependent FMN reductase [Planctomycetota bacterium]
MARNVRVLAVCGSCDPGSKTMKALRLAAGAVSEAGGDVEVLDLRDYPLPILFSPHAPAGSDAAVDAVKAKFREADALLIGSPEYHGSYSGALKNLLDLMGFEEFEGKMVALVGVAGGALGATNALNHLRTVCRQLHSWVLPDQVSVAHSSNAFDAAGRPTDAGTAKRLQDLGVQLVKFALLHRDASANAFVQYWEQSLQNPGG